MVSLLLIGIAAMLNALIDTLVHHFNRSIFSSKDIGFWDPSLSWKNKYIGRRAENGHKMIGPFKYPVQLTDAWHLFKFLMLLCLILAIVVYQPLFTYWEYTELNLFTDFVIMGVSWILVFNLFYNTLFLKR